MSNFQFIEYAAKRKIERELELVGKRRGGMNQKSMIESVTENVPNLFRVFSRQKGLFVFPPTIERPMPPKKDELIKESIITSYSKEKVNEISVKLNEIFAVEEDRLSRLEEYLGSLNDEQNEIANELIGKLYSDEPDEYSSREEWLKSFKFSDSNSLNLDLDVTSD